MAYKRLSPISIASGGTNATSMANTDGVAYFDGTLINTTAVGTAGQVLTSNGTGVAPTFNSVTAVSSLAGDSGGALTGALTLTGGTSGATFAGSGVTLTQSFNFLAIPDNTSTSVGYIQWGAGKYTIAGNNTNNTFFFGPSNVLPTSFTSTSCSIMGSTSNPTMVASSSNITIVSKAPSFLNPNSNSTFIGNCTSAIEGQTLTVVGYNTGNFTNTGSTLATYIGRSAQPGGSSAANNVTIGAGNNSIGTANRTSYIRIGSSSHVSLQNTLQIGTSGSGSNQQNQCFIGGIQGATVTGVAMLVSATDQLGVAASSARFKTDIQDMSDSSKNVLSLRPITFLWNKNSASSLKNASKDRQYGLIAEEVNEVMPELVAKDSENKPFSVHYRDLSILILNEIKKLKQRLYEIKLRKGVL
jgi:hypothetical protein